MNPSQFSFRHARLCLTVEMFWRRCSPLILAPVLVGLLASLCWSGRVCGGCRGVLEGFSSFAGVPAVLVFWVAGLLAGRPPAIVTICSHSALQILAGARREGLGAIGIVDRGREAFYSIGLGKIVDRLIVVDSFKEVCRRSFWDRVRSVAGGDIVVVPHGSFVEYVGPECFRELDAPILGSRELVEVEASQVRKMRFLAEAGIPTPKTYVLEEVLERGLEDGLYIVKLSGAKGGRGYFLARNRREVVEGVERLRRQGLLREGVEVVVQEYLVGVPMYVHYFYSRVRERLELFGLDIRYESNVDGLRRLPPAYAAGVEPSFTVVGNIPVVARESLLPKFYEYGLKFVKAAQRLLRDGIVGPFSLEGVVNDRLEYIVFEFSGRIVAGTNVYAWHGSPLTVLWWGEPMDMGRRIALEVREAWEQGILDKILS